MHPYMHSSRRIFSVLMVLVSVGAFGVLGAGHGLATPAQALGTLPLQENGSAPQATATPCGAGAGWNVVAAPDGSSYSNALYGVAAISSADAWAVGEQYSSNLSAYVALLEHWDGSAWSVVAGSPYGLTQRAVAALATNDVWVVGWMGGYGFSP